MIDNPYNRPIVWIGGSKPNDLPNVIHIESLDSLEMHEENSLLIIDDLGNEACNDKRVSDLFTKKSHHNGLGVILILQNLFNPGKYTRTITQNAQYLVFFKNPRDLTTIHFLSRQMAPNSSRYIIDAYNHATRNAYGYLFLDFTQETPDQLRVRTDIFNIISIVYTQ